MGIFDIERPRSAPNQGTGLKLSAAGRFLSMVVLGAWFFLVFPTEPLYFENQNTKFLHGMASAGIGHLERDWTAGTTDVMPVFTGIVYLLHVVTPPFVIYLVQMALFAVFLYAVVVVAGVAAGGLTLSVRTFSVVVGALTVASQFSNGGARVWGGVAKQYLLGPALEPQSFGVLFLLAVVLFLRRRTEAALWLTAVPALIHPGYVVPAGTLILAFLFTSWRDPDRSRRPRWLVAMFALVAAATSMLYLGLMILPTSVETWNQANEILAKIRIPDHAVPARWFDVDAAAKIAGLVLALWLLRKRCPDLFWIIAFGFGTALGLTLLTAALDSAELGMISPWRISVYLVPLGLTVLIGRAAAAILDGAERSRGASILCNGLGIALAVLVVAVTVRGAMEKARLYGSEPEPAHTTYMRETADETTLYLTDPGDMDIRLESGLPQLVSWKSHPYKDVEVLEWYRRYQLAERVFAGDAIDCAAVEEAIASYGVTHLLIDDSGRSMGCARVEMVFEDRSMRLFSLQLK